MEGGRERKRGRDGRGKGGRDGGRKGEREREGGEVRRYMYIDKAHILQHSCVVYCQPQPFNRQQCGVSAIPDISVQTHARRVSTHTHHTVVFMSGAVSGYEDTPLLGTFPFPRVSGIERFHCTCTHTRTHLHTHTCIHTHKAKCFAAA